MIIKNLQKNRGFVILFAVTISAILLAITLGVATVAFKEVQFGTSAKDTNNAFFAADTGIECALMNDKSAGTSFVSGGTSVQCLGGSIPITGASPIWNFVVSGLGGSRQSCANITVDKTDSSTTTITSKGYNIGNATCSPFNANRVERELKTTYSSNSAPPSPVVIPPVIIKTFGAANINLNDTTSLTFTITNSNAFVSLSGISFGDNLPSGLVIATPNGQSGSCGGGTISATAGGTSVSLSGATLAANSSCNFSVNVKGTTAGLKHNITSAVTSTEGGNGGTASADITVAISNANPTSLVLTQTANNRSFSVSWTGGSGNGGAGGCKLQFSSGASWIDITSATNMNCDASLSLTPYNLNGDGWKAGWNGTQVRILRKIDSVVMGTFGTTLSCNSMRGSTSSFSSQNIDEDCDGYWNNTSSPSGDAACQAQGGGQYCMDQYDYASKYCPFGQGMKMSTYCTDNTACISWDTGSNSFQDNPNGCSTTLYY